MNGSTFNQKREIKVKLIRQQDAMTLIEVVCSVVIIGIILISFTQLIIKANETTAYNNDKLVTINLADAALAKLQGTTLKKDPSITNFNQYFVESNGVPSTIQLNGNSYTVSYQASQTNSSFYAGGNTEKDLNLVKVVVTVEAPGGKKSSSSEGYVKIE